ncbi:C10 family peptidase [Planctomycetota bacterium]
MVVTGWLKANPQPLGSDISRQIMNVETFTDNLGEPAYHIVYLQPSGFVIVSADDRVEPIIAFSSNGTYDPAPASPLKALVTKDLKARNDAVRSTFVPLSITPQVAVSETQKKWNFLIGLAGVSNGGYEPMAIAPILDDSLSDIRVPPLAQSKWGQSNYYDSNDQPRACYNYCTPQLINNRGSFVEGHVDNYPVGCVAVAVAQFVLSQRYPQEPLGPKEFTISIEGQKADCSLLGGDDPDGAYNWDDMVLVPDDDTTEQQRRTIGAFCFDAAIAVDTEFGRDGSGASLDNTVKALLETFEYGNAVWAEGEGGHVTRKHFLSLFNPNLDAGIPVILGFRNSDYPWYGHAAICDGYGYNLSKLYHHLNMGWEGQEDCWYSLPDIAYPDMVPFDAITQCVYNIFTEGTGEIISGRIVDSNGVPFAGITVMAQSETDSDVHTVVTNSNGIYAFICLDSDTAYTVSPDMLGYNFDLNFGYGPEHNIVTTGRSGGGSFVTGNKWGVDFIGYRNSDPNSSGQESQVVGADVKLTASDGARNDRFGTAVAMSGDYAIVGAYGDDDNRGAAYIFKREGTSWIEQAKLRTPGFRQPDDYFGYSVDINGDYAIVGAYGSEMRRGAAYVFKRDVTSWTQRTELRSVNMATYDRFGITVSISGNYAIVGSPEDDSDTLTSHHRDWGSVSIFELDGETWIQKEKLFASNGSEEVCFGAVVSICGDYAIVSSGSFYPSPSYGPVYIMKRDGITWTEQVILSSLERSFGNSVSISEDYAVIGAPYENNDNGDGSGSVYVYIREDASWEQQVILTASDGEPFDSFGRSLSINESCIIIGAPDDDDHYMGRDSGSAYIFEQDSEGWTQRAKLTALDAAYDDFFGTSVAIDGDYTIVGAPGDDDNGRESGSVYVFKRIGSTWTP